MGSANQIAREFLLVLVALRALPRIQFSLQALVFFSHLLLKVHEVLSMVEFSKVCSPEKNLRKGPFAGVSPLVVLFLRSCLICGNLPDGLSAIVASKTQFSKKFIALW